MIDIKDKVIELMANALSYCGYDKAQCGGDAYTEWICNRCGQVFIHPTTNHPELCADCIRIIFEEMAKKGGENYD